MACSQAVLYGTGPIVIILDRIDASRREPHQFQAASTKQLRVRKGAICRRGGCQCGSIFALQRSCDAWPRGREGRRPTLRRCDGISPPDVPSSLIRFALIDCPCCHVPLCGSLLHIHSTPDILDELRIAAVEIEVAQRELGWLLFSQYDTQKNRTCVH